MKAFFLGCCILSLNLEPAVVNAETSAPHITLADAEVLALKTSNEIKAFSAQSEAYFEKSQAQFAPLLPDLRLDGFYQYLTHVPAVKLQGVPGSFPVGVHTPYTFSATLSYTIWDTFSNINAYKSAAFLSQSQKENEQNTKLEVLLNVRTSYLLVQLSLAELSAIYDSLELARSQFRDIDTNYKAGAATRLDWNDASRNVLSYELQYEQKRVDVTLNAKNLFALLNMPATIEIFSPESSKITQEITNLNIQFDSLNDTLERTKLWRYEQPSEKQPSLQIQTFLAKSYTAQADSTFGKLFPKIDISAKSQVIYPDIIQIQLAQQNAFTVSVSMPVFDGNRIIHQVAESKKNALAAQWNHDQIKINLNRDYQKALDMLKSLKKQKEINKMDIEAAQRSAQMYYDDYQGGTGLLINVQRANVQVLLSQMQSAQITAQILNQLFQLQFLSGNLSS